MFRAREILVRLPKRFKPTTILQSRRTFCSKPSTNANNTNAEETSVSSYQEQYKQLEKLDFMTATKMLFTAPPSKKKFGYCFASNFCNIAFFYCSFDCSVRWYCFCRDWNLWVVLGSLWHFVELLVCMEVDNLHSCDSVEMEGLLKLEGARWVF